MASSDNFEFNFQEAYVQCYSLDGARIDHQFTVSLTNVQASWQDRPMAYLTGGGLAGQPSPGRMRTSTPPAR